MIIGKRIVRATVEMKEMILKLPALKASSKFGKHFALASN
jgi:hypothetical protein